MRSSFTTSNVPGRGGASTARLGPAGRRRRPSPRRPKPSPSRRAGRRRAPPTRHESPPGLSARVAPRGRRGRRGRSWVVDQVPGAVVDVEQHQVVAPSASRIVGHVARPHLDPASASRVGRAGRSRRASTHERRLDLGDDHAAYARVVQHLASVYPRPRPPTSTLLGRCDSRECLAASARSLDVSGCPSRTPRWPAARASYCRRPPCAAGDELAALRLRPRHLHVAHPRRPPPDVIRTGRHSDHFV